MAWPTSITKVNVDEATDNPALGRAELEDAIDAINAVIAGRATTNGVCELDGAGKVPIARYDAIESLSKALFKQNWVPNTWTFVAEHDDRAIINTATQASGGNTNVSTWTITGLSGGSHSLTVSEMPAHSHSVSQGKFSCVYSTGYRSQANCRNQNNQSTGSSGGGTAHSHTVSQDGTWRPPYVLVITCQKD